MPSLAILPITLRKVPSRERSLIGVLARLGAVLALFSLAAARPAFAIGKAKALDLLQQGRGSFDPPSDPEALEKLGVLSSTPTFWADPRLPFSFD